MDYTHHQLDAIRDALRGELIEWLDDTALADMPLSAMSPEQLVEIHDAAQNALINGAPIVRSYTAQQDKGPYPVWIAGIDGVYHLLASEYDVLGPFDTLSDAVDAMERSYGRFLIGG